MPTTTSAGPNEAVRLEVLRLAPPLPGSGSGLVWAWERLTPRALEGRGEVPSSGPGDAAGDLAATKPASAGLIPGKAGVEPGAIGAGLVAGLVSRVGLCPELSALALQ
jgi:hypothetical protein